MNMTPGSWEIYKISFYERNDGLHQAYVLAGVLEYGCDWPNIILDEETGKSFQFASNEAMETWMVGNHSGHARYVEIAGAK